MPVAVCCELRIQFLQINGEGDLVPAVGPPAN
jgi:hypothetical protein